MSNGKINLNDIYEKLGKVEANTDTTLKTVNTLIEEQKITKIQVTKNKMNIKYIYGVAAFIITSISYIIFELYKKLWR